MKMREILFHGKRADNGEWVEGDVLQTRYHSGHIEYQIMPQTPVSSAYPVLSETIGQYTGLTDRNGKRIFEGDIIEYYGKNGKIEYSVCATFDIISDTWNTDFKDIYEKDIEVIGNIHDNPELME